MTLSFSTSHDIPSNGNIEILFNGIDLTSNYLGAANQSMSLLSTGSANPYLLTVPSNMFRSCTVSALKIYCKVGANSIKRNSLITFYTLALFSSIFGSSSLSSIVTTDGNNYIDQSITPLSTIYYSNSFTNSLNSFPNQVNTVGLSTGIGLVLSMSAPNGLSPSNKISIKGPFVTGITPNDFNIAFGLSFSGLFVSGASNLNFNGGSILSTLTVYNKLIEVSSTVTS